MIFSRCRAPLRAPAGAHEDAGQEEAAPRVRGLQGHHPFRVGQRLRPRRCAPRGSRRAGAGPARSPAPGRWPGRAPGQGAVALAPRLVDAGHEDAGGDVLWIGAEGGLQGDLGFVVFLELDEDPAQGHERGGVVGMGLGRGLEHAPRLVEVAQLAVALGQAELGQLVVRDELQRLAERGDRVGHLAGRAMGLPELRPQRGVARRETPPPRDSARSPPPVRPSARSDRAWAATAWAGGGRPGATPAGRAHTRARVTSATQPARSSTASHRKIIRGVHYARCAPGSSRRPLSCCCRSVARGRRSRPDARRPRPRPRTVFVKDGRPVTFALLGLIEFKTAGRAVRVHRPRGRPLVVPGRRRAPGVRRPPAAARPGEPAGLDDLREAAGAAGDPHPRGAGRTRSPAGPPARRRSSPAGAGGWTRASTGRRSWTSSSAGRRR